MIRSAHDYRRHTLALLVVVVALGSVDLPAARQQRQPRVDSPRRESAARNARKITPEQRNRVADKIALTSEIVTRLAPQAKALGRATAEHAADSAGVIGEVGSDLLFFPTAPCRWSDTPNVGGRIRGFRGFDIALDGPAYGGTSTCNPASVFGVAEDEVAAVAFNVTIVDPTQAPGFVALKPHSTSPTTSFINWYEAGPFVQAANMGIVVFDTSPADADEYVIQSSDPVHVIQDLFGAFLPPIASPFDQQIKENSAMIPSGFTVSLLSPTRDGSWSLTGGGCKNPNNANLVILETAPFISAPAVDPKSWSCRARNDSVSTVTVTVIGICSRVAGRP